MSENCDIVLLTYPKYNLIRYKNPKNTNNYFYFNPWTGNWSTSRRFKKDLELVGKTKVDWYNRWILNIVSDLDIPRCKNKLCKHNNPKVKFINLIKGYEDYCCTSCSKSSPKRMKSLENFYSSGGAFGVMYNNPIKYKDFHKNQNKLLKEGKIGYGRVMKDEFLKKEYMDKNPTIKEGGLYKYLRNHSDIYKDSLDKLKKFNLSGGSFGNLIRTKGMEYVRKLNVIDEYYSHKLMRYIPCRSNYEKRINIILDNLDNVTYYEYEPFILHYVMGDKVKLYYPDYLVYLNDIKVLLEVKNTFDLLNNDNAYTKLKLKYIKSLEFCEFSMIDKYQIITEIELNSWDKDISQVDLVNDTESLKLFTKKIKENG